MKKKEWKNKLICGDNLKILPTIKSDSVDLVYIDPPFFSNRSYEIIWGDEAEIRSFEDRWEGGVEVYIDWMRERVMELYRVLKPTGSFYLHCDWHAGHYLKVMCDEIFGGKNFQNEIIWHYQTGGATKIRYSRKHDNILFYTKGKKWIFNSEVIKIKRTEKSLKRAQTPKGARISKNDIYKNPDDVFIIPQMNPMAKERLGYPTQKPEALLERIIKASSNKGDLVLDAFCGCGTTMAVSQQLGRRWIGIDISPSAIALVKNRLAKLGVSKANMVVVGMPKKVEDLKKFKPFEFQYWVINEMHGTPSGKIVGDMGIDGFSFFHHYPIQVKQSKKVGREVIDKFETAIRRYYQKRPKGKERRGIIVAFSFTRGAREEVARVKRREKIEIDLLTIKVLLEKGISIPDFQTQPLF